MSRFSSLSSPEGLYIDLQVSADTSGTIKYVAFLDFLFPPLCFFALFMTLNTAVDF